MKSEMRRLVYFLGTVWFLSSVSCSETTPTQPPPPPTTSTTMTSTTTTTVPEAANPPVANLAGPPQGVVEREIDFDASGSTTENRPLRYFFTFGDDTQRIDTDNPVVTHTYALFCDPASGTQTFDDFRVGLRVRDAADGEDRDSYQIRITCPY